MQKLTALHQHLQSQNQFDENLLDSWAEKAVLVPGGRNITVGQNDMQGRELGLVQYDAIFAIENFSGSAFVLIAQVFAWLAEHDNNREQYSLGEPELDVAPIDAGRCDVEIRITFLEPLQLVRDDAAGNIVVDGIKWRVDEPIVYTAEASNVLPKNSQGGDV